MLRFPKKTLLAILLASTLFLPVFAETKGNIPDWMNNSVIVLSDYLYGTHKTVKDLFGGTPLETTNTVITSSDKQLVIVNEMVVEGSVIIRITTTFVMNKVGDAGTCYPSKFILESPMTFQSQTMSCYGGPYDDPEGYGQILGALSQCLPLLYEQ